MDPGNKVTSTTNTVHRTFDQLHIEWTQPYSTSVPDNQIRVDMLVQNVKLQSVMTAAPLPTGSKHGELMQFLRELSTGTKDQQYVDDTLGKLESNFGVPQNEKVAVLGIMEDALHGWGYSWSV